MVKSLLLLGSGFPTPLPRAAFPKPGLRIVLLALRSQGPPGPEDASCPQRLPRPGNLLLHLKTITNSFGDSVWRISKHFHEKSFPAV